MLKGVITVVVKLIIDGSGNRLAIDGQEPKNSALKRLLQVHHTRVVIYYYFLIFCLASDIKLTTRTTASANRYQRRVCIKIRGTQVLIITQNINTIHIGTTRQN